VLHNCVLELHYLVNLKDSVKNAFKLKVRSEKVQTAEKAYFRRHQEVAWGSEKTARHNESWRTSTVLCFLTT